MKNKLSTHNGVAPAGSNRIDVKIQKFWITLAGAACVVVLALCDWMIIPAFAINAGYNLFSLFNLWGKADNSGAYFLLAGTEAAAGVKYVLLLLIIILLTSFVLLETSLLNRQSKKVAKLAFCGFGLSAVASIIFIIIMVGATKSIIGARLTAVPYITFAIAILAGALNFEKGVLRSEKEPLMKENASSRPQKAPLMEENASTKPRKAPLRLPDKFWMTSLSILCVVGFTQLNWIKTAAFSFAVDLNIFSLFSLWGKTDATGEFALLSGGLDFPALKFLFLVLVVLLLSAFLLLVASIIKHQSKYRSSLAFMGFGVSALIPLIYLACMLPLQSRLVGTSLTVLPYLLFAFAIFAIVAHASQKNAGYLFLVPFVVVFLIFMLYPLLYTAIIGFTNLQGMAKTQWQILEDPLENFKMILHNKSFLVSLRNTFKIWIINFVPQLGLALLLTAWFTRRRNKIKGQGLFKVLYYMPNIITAATIAILFNVLFMFPVGPINHILTKLGWIEKPFNFIVSKTATQLIIAFVQFWMWYGYTMLILISGVMGLNPEMYESADIDGATGAQQFFFITIPNLRTILLFTLVTSLVGGLNMFDMSRLFNNGMPDLATTSVSLFVFQQAFAGSYLYNRAAAASMIVFVIIALLSAGIFFIMRDKDMIRQKKEEKALRRRIKAERGAEV